MSSPPLREHHAPWRRLLQPVLNLWLESACPLCDRPATAVVCRDCDRRLQESQLPAAMRLTIEQGLPILAWGAYQGSVRRAIAALKYENQPQLAQPLARSLAEIWRNNPIGSSVQRPIVVPIPLHADKQRQRGYNQALLLAQHFCQITGLPLERQGLIRSQATTAQFSLSAAARSRNLEGAFQVGPGLATGRHRPQMVLLLDDIYTSGATIRAATQTFQQQGIRVIGAVAIARALRVLPTKTQAPS